MRLNFDLLDDMTSRESAAATDVVAVSNRDVDFRNTVLLTLKSEIAVEDTPPILEMFRDALESCPAVIEYSELEFFSSYKYNIKKGAPVDERVGGNGVRFNVNFHFRSIFEFMRFVWLMFSVEEKVNLIRNSWDCVTIYEICEWKDTTFENGFISRGALESSSTDLITDEVYKTARLFRFNKKSAEKWADWYFKKHMSDTKMSDDIIELD